MIIRNKKKSIMLSMSEFVRGYDHVGGAWEGCWLRARDGVVTHEKLKDG